MRISDWSSDVCSSDLALGDLLAGDLLLGLEARAGALDRQLRDLFAGRDVLAQPQRERVVRRAFDEAGGLARRQPLLGLRSEERRVGKEGVRTCRFRWSPDH